MWTFLALGCGLSVVRGLVQVSRGKCSLVLGEHAHLLVCSATLSAFHFGSEATRRLPQRFGSLPTKFAKRAQPCTMAPKAKAKAQAVAKASEAGQRV